LKRVALLPRIPNVSRDTMKLRVNERNQLIQRARVALAPGGKQRCHFTSRVHL
jgi:hypothetical protein